MKGPNRSGPRFRCTPALLTTATFLLFTLFSVQLRVSYAVDPAPSSPRFTPGFNAITGSGYLASSGTNSLDCSTNSYIGLTHVTADYATNATMNVSFSIVGGSDGIFYDVFGNASLTPSDPSCQWAWVGQGVHCVTYLLTNLPASRAFLILGTSEDSDFDGLTDAYESLVSHTKPDDEDSDNDSVPDGMEIIQGRNPNAPGAGADTGGAIGFSLYTPLD